MRRLGKEEFLAYAKRYETTADAASLKFERETERRIASDGKKFLSKHEMLAIVRWKAGDRALPLCQKNSEEVVREVTKASFTATTEQAQVRFLLALSGVSYTLASTILRFKFPDRYPVLDAVTLSAVTGVNGEEAGPVEDQDGMDADEADSYTYEIWSQFMADIHRLAARHNLSVAVMERALRQYARERKNVQDSAQRLPI